MPKIIVFNGPPKSGKDTIGSAVCKLLGAKGFYPCVRDKFAAPLKRAVGAFVGLTEAEHSYFFESPAKDMPSERFFGKTPRSVLISFSEDWAKGFGKDVFGQLMVQRILTMKENGLVLITDCGFTEELTPLKNAFGEASMALVRLDRDSTSYEGDSRSKIALENVLTLDVKNDRDVFEVAEQIIEELGEWLDELV